MAGIGGGAVAAQSPVGAMPQAAGGGAMPPMDAGAVASDPDAGNVSPEEQALYDQFLRNASLIIYQDNKLAPEIVANLKGEWSQEIAAMFEAADPPLSGEPIDNVAATATLITMMLEGSSAAAGQPTPDDILFHAGSEICAELVDLGEDIGLFELEDNGAEMAFYRAIELYAKVSPRMDEAAKAALATQFEELMTADEQGQLGDLMRTETA